MESLGCTDERVFEDIYEYYARGEAWKLSPGAVESLQRIRALGEWRDCPGVCRWNWKSYMDTVCCKEFVRRTCPLVEVAAQEVAAHQTQLLG